MTPLPEFEQRPRITADFERGMELAQQYRRLRAEFSTTNDPIEIHNLLIESPRVVNGLSEISAKEHNTAAYGTGLGLALIIISPSFPPVTGLLVGLGLWILGSGISSEVLSKVHEHMSRRLQSLGQRFSVNN